MSDILTAADETFLRHCIELSRRVRDGGKHPFAAIVVDELGRIVAEAGNDSVPPDGDPTRHAELVAAGLAARRLTPDGDPTRHAELVAAGLAARRLTPGQLSRATLYTSAEPCAMCAGAIYWCGIGRVVYALSEHRLLGLTGDHPENPTFSLPCREVFARGQRRIAVTGPCLEDEAAAPHAGFWTRE